MEPESQSSSAHKADNPARSRRNSNNKVVSILDVVAKLIAAGAVVAATLIASRFESSMTATNLLSQREQADSTLRASMFHDLIGPIVGSEKSNGGIPEDREQLLVELLALNFHEHFEFKPLMLHLDYRLAHEDTKAMDQTRRQIARESLRSIGRRVLQRQLAMLTKAESELPVAQQAHVCRLDLEERPEQQITQQEPLHSPQSCPTPARYFDDLISVDSPNGIYTLAFAISKPERWEDQSFQVLMRINNKAADNKSVTATADHDFLLTWFDFPFTDNTLLADGTRFSLVIDQVKPKGKKATFKLVWFPEDYFSARERPTNYRELRGKLGLTLER